VVKHTNDKLVSSSCEKHEPGTVSRQRDYAATQHLNSARASEALPSGGLPAHGTRYGYWLRTVCQGKQVGPVIRIGGNSIAAHNTVQDFPPVI
jgi:hypothetical protein